MLLAIANCVANTLYIATDLTKNYTKFAILLIIIVNVFPSASERQDFNSSVLTVIFQADEIGLQISDILVPVGIFDDDIDEAQEEVFIIDLTLQSSINNSLEIARRSSLCRINDDDGKYIISIIYTRMRVRISLLT